MANGFAIEIEDRGLGMSADELAAANARIVDRSELNLADAARLGLFVVSRLTERHGVKVQLKESAYGGTTAVVLIPRELITADGADEADALPAPGTALPAAPAPDPVRSTPAADSDGPAPPSGPDDTAEPDQPAEPAPHVPEPVTQAPWLTPSGLPARTASGSPRWRGRPRSWQWWSGGRPARRTRRRRRRRRSRRPRRRRRRSPTRDRRSGCVRPASCRSCGTTRARRMTTPTTTRRVHRAGAPDDELLPERHPTRPYRCRAPARRSAGAGGGPADADEQVT
ncbi:ATP-binding protein [Micromonospora sp. BRA006-A]|nr:ATP-binding protein [Micromonospora sp. BRA006-A]